MSNKEKSSSEIPQKLPFSFDRETSVVAAELTGAKITHGDRAGYILQIGEFPASGITDKRKYGSAQVKNPGSVTGFHHMYNLVLTDITVGGDEGNRSLVEIQSLEAINPDGTNETISRKTKVSEFLGIGKGFDGVLVEETSETNGRAFKIISREDYERIQKETVVFEEKGKKPRRKKEKRDIDVDEGIRILNEQLKKRK